MSASGLRRDGRRKRTAPRIAGGMYIGETAAVPAAFNKTWPEGKLHGRVTSTLERLGYGIWRVRYVVATAA